MTVDEDPFAEPDDTDRTVIRPNPGGRRAGIASAPPVEAHAAPVAAPAPEPADSALDDSLTGMNPLVASAATLFALISRIRNRAQHTDPEALRQAVIAGVRSFETDAMRRGCDPQQVKVARYAICATLDDVVLNTPWGGTSGWGEQSLVSTFHRETVGGDRFYDLLSRLEQDPARNIVLLEFLFMCLSLGFEGRLRVENGGADRHLQVRQGLASTIRQQRGPVESDLSPHWKGVQKPFRALSAWRPFWIAATVMAAIGAMGFLSLSWALSSRTERLLGTMTTLESGPPPELARRAPPVAAAPVYDEEQMKRIAGFLSAEIEEKLVTVFQDANTITIRMKGAGMFGSGSDVLKPEFKAPISRVAAALAETSGPVLIAGHSDSQPIRSARFPSNMHLSLARAESVRKMLATQIADPARLTAEGRADREPIAPNDTAAGRAENRRIEIVLQREGVPAASVPATEKAVK
ncbi:type VI secretion system protein TssL, long form [Paracoccus sp. NGMCC 1.201697]|uniref:Type VI secretion system protein TssL, long form n=1 Tax=Paracoccus broussonetiae subsp. drimophilus TaxID=3373869 RepID=A0ABW7LGM7_9RHOB